METGLKKLTNPGRTAILYFIAKFCFNMMACLEMYYWSAYATDSALLPTALLFIPLTIPTVVDFIMSFLNGVIIEKSKHPLGKYTFWMGIGPIVAGICYTLCYVRYKNDVTCAVIMCILVCIAHFFWNIAEITHTSVPSILTDVPAERSTLSMLQAAGQSWSAFVFGLIALPIINAVNAKVGNLTTGYTVMCALAALMYIIGYGLLAINIRGMEKREEQLVATAAAKKAAAANDEKAAKLSGKEMLASFFQNGPLVALTFSQLCSWLVSFTGSGFQYYFFNCSLGAIAMMSLSMSSKSFAGMFSMLLFPVYQKVFKGNKKVIRCIGIITSIWNIVFWVGRWGVGSFIVVGAILAFVMGPSGMVTLAMYADCATYAQWKTGADSRAFVMSTYSIPLKLALMIRGVLTSALFVAINYDATLDPATYKDTFYNLYLLLMGIIQIIGVLIIVFFYKLDEKKVSEMALEIQKRSESAA